MDICNDEILWRNRAARESPQHDKLSGMGHRIGEWTLEHALGRCIPKRSCLIEMMTKVLE